MLVFTPTQIYIFLMFDILLNQRFETQKSRSLIYKSNLIDTICRFKFGHAVQLVGNYITIDTLCKFNNKPHTLFITFIADFGDTFNFLFFAKSINIRDQSFFRYLIWNTRKNQNISSSPGFDFIFSTNTNSTFTSSISVTQLILIDNNTTSWEIWTGNTIQNFIFCGCWISKHQSRRVHNFLEIMRSKRTCHSNCDTSSTITQQIRETTRQINRLFTSFTIIRHPISRILFNMLQGCFCNGAQTTLSITIRCRTITITRTIITMEINQWITHRPRLRSMNQCAINGTITMRMILSHCITNRSCALNILLTTGNTIFLHFPQDTAHNRFHAIFYCWDGSISNYGQRIIQK